ncbi:homeobox-leucine zipper protein HAT22-like isoform X1 [Zingiber officinale]|nr:homeobox-leucine zipper protein HAT22-like isoform X1 [Zingiber officinale]
MLRSNIDFFIHFPLCSLLFIKPSSVSLFFQPNLLPFMEEEEEEEEECNTRLALGIGDYGLKSNARDSTSTLHFDALFPIQFKEEQEELDEGVSGKETSNCSSERHSVGARKKLKLTREQVMLLEESFSQHSTLNTKQKQELGERLGIQPRQVEVWFQNRRARTKTKRMEVDYEYLKRSCEMLNEENRRLKKELMQLVKSTTMTVSVCSSCERMAGARKSVVVDGLILRRRT